MCSFFSPLSWTYSNLEFHICKCFSSQKVIEVSKKYLPKMATSFADPRLTVHVGDGFEFMKRNQEAFDVIITDSSDPVGPAESLFQDSYFTLLKSALRPGGIISSQGNDLKWLPREIIWYHTQHFYYIGSQTVIPGHTFAVQFFFLCNCGIFKEFYHRKLKWFQTWYAKCVS